MPIQIVNRRQLIARRLIGDDATFISTQVLQELVNTLTRKFKIPYLEAIEAVNESIRNNHLFTNTDQYIIQACSISQNYSFSFYDSLIITSALQCDCQMLYSEDMTNGQIIQGKLRIIILSNNLRAPWHVVKELCKH